MERVKKYTEKKAIDLQNYARFFRLIRKFQELVWDIPSNLYFPLFDVNVNRVKNTIERKLDECQVILRACI
jgi:hypothetical protein